MAVEWRPKRQENHATAPQLWWTTPQTGVLVRLLFPGSGRLLLLTSIRSGAAMGLPPSDTTFKTDDIECNWFCLCGTHLSGLLCRRLGFAASVATSNTRTGRRRQIYTSVKSVQRCALAQMAVGWPTTGCCRERNTLRIAGFGNARWRRGRDVGQCARRSTIW